MKTLYFEGAGWPEADISKATIGNCRIRTAFSLDNGKRIFLEICVSEVCKNDWRLKTEKGKEMTEHQKELASCAPYIGFIDSCHYITDDKPNDDCNKHTIVRRNITCIPYTLKGILKFVNSLGASFDCVEIAPELGGYRVFPECNSCSGIDGYYYGDEFQPNSKQATQAEEVKNHFYALEKGEGKEFPNFSLWVDEFDSGLLHLIRHFPGKNRHWVIRTDTDSWGDTMQETKLGRYAC